MINVSIFEYNNGLINKIEIKGHSGYDVTGKDIVCSSVSTAFILSVNLLEKLKNEYAIEYECIQDENIPLMSLNIGHMNSNEQVRLVQTILENLVENLEMVSKQYQKFLNIKKFK